MDNVDEIVALLRKQSDLENQILNGHGTAAKERDYVSSASAPDSRQDCCRALWGRHFALADT